MGYLTDADLDSGGLRRRLNSSTSGLHYWDESVGRRCFMWDTVNNRWQMVYGDTGWRDVSASLINGWTGTLRVRRIGYVVHVSAGMNGTAATNNNFWTFTSGWTAPYNSMVLPAVNNATTPIFAQASNGNNALASPDRTSSVSIHGAYTTTDA